MINAAVVGLGWWGKTLVEAVQGTSQEIRFVAGATGTISPEVQDFAKAQGLALHKSYEELLKDASVDAVVLATPNSMHAAQIIAAARAGKHVFCEKPLVLTKAEAQTVVAEMQKAGRVLALDYNRRFHPTMKDLDQRVKTGALGTVLHFEGTMTFPNALYLKPTQWRAQRSETPCGGLMPMGVHVIDAAIGLFGEVAEVYCTSLHRAVAIDADDTTAMLFRMKNGMSGYLSTMTATAGSFRLQVYGSEGWVRINGITHIAGASSEERRSRLFGDCTYQPVKGAAQNWQAESFDVSRAALESFARAAAGGPAFPIPVSEMIHGVAVTEAAIRSAASGRSEKVL
jgi:predicted dehydrogenase